MMLQKRLIVIITTAALWFLLAVPNAQSQSETPKIEIGVQFAALGLDSVKRQVSAGSAELTILRESTDPGFGFRMTRNVNHRVSAEGEINFFPQDRFGRGQRTEGLFGVKLSARVENAGVFIKLRPGFVHFGQASSLALSPNGSIFNDTNFAVDLGGGFEYYPSRHTMVRLDLGETVIRLSGIRCSLAGCPSAVITHNFQFNLGVGVRF